MAERIVEAIYKVIKMILMIKLSIRKYRIKNVITLIAAWRKVELSRSFLMEIRSISGPNPNEIISIPDATAKIIDTIKGERDTSLKCHSIAI